MRFRFSISIWLSHSRPLSIAIVSSTAIPAIVATTISISVVGICVCVSLRFGISIWFSYSIWFSRPPLPAPVAVTVGSVVAAITVASVAIAIPWLWLSVGLRGWDGSSKGQEGPNLRKKRQVRLVRSQEERMCSSPGE